MNERRGYVIIKKLLSYLSRVGLQNIKKYNNIMPPCIKGDKCQCPTAALEKRHFCAICKKELHGPCGVFNGDDSAITYCNRCSSCSVDGSEAAASSATSANDAPFTQQSTLISSKDVDPKKVSWADTGGGDRPSGRQANWSNLLPLFVELIQCYSAQNNCASFDPLLSYQATAVSPKLNCFTLLVLEKYTKHYMTLLRDIMARHMPKHLQKPKIACFI
jgi:hypothetical protein